MDTGCRLYKGDFKISAESAKAIDKAIKEAKIKRKGYKMKEKLENLEDVLNAIREERDYQDKLWGNTQERGEHSIGEFLLYIDDYLQEAKHIISRKAAPGCNKEALHIVRKLATLCIACMELNGVERRDMGDLNKKKELHGVE